MGMAMAIGSAVMGVYSQNKALEAQAQANYQTSKNYITSMNFSFQNLEQERMDAFEATIDDLQKTKLQGYRQVSGVEAAVNEGLAGGGRTADLIKRAAHADVKRATDSIKDNYARKSNEIDLNKEAALVNAKMQTSSIQQVKKPSLLSTVFQLGTAYLGAMQTQDSLSAIKHTANADGLGAGKFYDHTWNLATGANDFYSFGDTPDYSSILGSSKSTNSYSFSYTNPYVSNNQTLSFF